MAAAGVFCRILLGFLFVLPVVLCLYEDQAGTFDWRQQYVGRVNSLHWEQQTGKSGGKRSASHLYVSSEKNVIAALNTVSGEISWRKVFESDDRGRVDTFLYHEEVLVSVLGGRRVAAWNPASGNLIWDVYLPGSEDFRANAVITGGKSKGTAVVMTKEGVYGLSLRDGSTKFSVLLSDSETVDYRYLTMVDDTVYAVGMASRSFVRVRAVDQEGTQLSDKKVDAGWITANTRCDVVQNTFLMCYCPTSESFQVLDMKNPQSFTATAVQDLGMSIGKVTVAQWNGDFNSDKSRGLVVQFTPDHAAMVTVKGQGHVQVKKNLPKVVTATIVVYDDRDYLLTLEHTGHEELTLAGYDVEENEEVPELRHKFHQPVHYGRPVEFTGVLGKKRAFKIVMFTEDSCLHLIHKQGKVAWRREESIAEAVAVEMVDLPVSENQAKFEDEFGSHEDNVPIMFVKRVTTQLSQLQTFITQQIQRLQGVRHHSNILMDEEEEEDEDDLLRDEFNQHKMIVIVTKPGKIIGMRSMNGHIVWQQYIPELAPFNKFGKEKVLLYIQRTTAHFPNPPQCVVLGRNRVSGRGHLFAFHPITGQHVEGMPPGGEHLNFNVIQAFQLGEMNEHFLKGIVMMDDSLKIHTYPSKIVEFVRQHLPSLYMYVADVDEGFLRGYRIATEDSTLIADDVWKINLQKKQQTITGIVGKRANEHVHSQGRVLGDRSVLYKYLNPNLIVVTTEGEEIGSQQKVVGFFNIYLVDTVTGHIVFSANHRKAQGPIHVIHSENWVVYYYYSHKHRRREMAVLEIFEGKDQSNSTSFSSFTAPTQPLVVRHSFIFPIPIYTMATTITEKGITSKNIIIALKTGGLFTLPKAFLDPRRPLIPTQETMEEGTVPYIPELPVHTESIINYNHTLYNIEGIHTSPAGLESTSLVLSYGLDLFHTRVQPSKMFDVLKEDFEYWLIFAVVVGMVIVSYVTRSFAARKALNRAWK